MTGGGVYFFYSRDSDVEQQKVAKRVRIEIPKEEEKELEKMPLEKKEPPQDTQKNAEESPHAQPYKPEEIKKVEKKPPVSAPSEVRKTEKQEEKPEIKFHQKVIESKGEERSDVKPHQKIKETKKEAGGQKDKQKNELKNITNGSWALNISSYSMMDDAKAIAKKLKDDGYNAYITEFNLKGKKWYRLRVGFFKSGEGARTEGKKIARAYNIQGIWTTKPTKREILNNQ